MAIVYRTDNYHVVATKVTGQTRGYPHLVSDPVNFPCTIKKDVIAEGCLDAPDWIPTGATVCRGVGFAGRLVILADFRMRPGTYS